MSNPRTHRILYASIALALLSLLVWGMWPRAVTVEVATVERQPLQVGFTEEGRTRLRDRFTISSPVEGELQRIELEPGDRVEGGQAVALLHPARSALLDPATWADAHARLQAAEAEQAATAAALEAARATQERAQRSFERLDILARARQVADERRDEAASDVQAAKAQVRSAAAQAQAALARRDAIATWLELQGSDRHDRGQLVLRAPIAGVLIQRFVQSEGPVHAGQPLLEVGDPNNLEVVVDVLSADALRLRPGMAVSLRPGEDLPVLRGSIRRMEPAAFTKVSALGVEEQRLRVIVQLPEGVGGLGDGYRVDAQFQVWRSASALTVPVPALFRDGPDWAVYVVGDGRARLRHLAIGHIGTERAEVLRGLANNSIVVVYPGDQLRDGDRVAPALPEKG